MFACESLCNRMGFAQNRKQSPLSRIYTKEQIDRSSSKATFIPSVIGTTDKETLNVPVHPHLQTPDAVSDLILCVTPQLFGHRQRHAATGVKADVIHKIRPSRMWDELSPLIRDRETESNDHEREYVSHNE